MRRWQWRCCSIIVRQFRCCSMTVRQWRCSMSSICLPWWEQIWSLQHFSQLFICQLIVKEFFFCRWRKLLLSLIAESNERKQKQKQKQVDYRGLFAWNCYQSHILEPTVILRGRKWVSVWLIMKQKYFNKFNAQTLYLVKSLIKIYPPKIKSKA